MTNNKRENPTFPLLEMTPEQEFQWRWQVRCDDHVVDNAIEQAKYDAGEPKGPTGEVNT